MMPDPYYETENGALYCGDCLDIMPLFEDIQFDLVLTDPPYGIGEAAGKNHSRESKNKKPTLYAVKSWDNSIPEPAAFNQLNRISKHQIIFGGNYFVEYLKPSPDYCDIIVERLKMETAQRKLFD